MQNPVIPPSGLGFTNACYSLLHNQGTFYQLSVVVFFEPGYGFDPGVPPTIVPLSPGSNIFTVNIFIKNMGNSEGFGFVPFNPVQNQLSPDENLFSLANIFLMDTTNGLVNTTKIHHQDVDVPDGL